MTNSQEPEPTPEASGPLQTSYAQSAVIPLRQTAEGLEMLLVTSRSGRRWVLPKGVVEPPLSPSASAAAEAYEEAGIRGCVDPEPLGRYSYRKWGGTCLVDVFPMWVEHELDDWPEAEVRRRAWFRLEEARRVLDERVPRQLLDALPPEGIKPTR